MSRWSWKAAAGIVMIGTAMTGAMALASPWDPSLYPNRSRVGVNLAGVNPFMSQWMFQDFAKYSTGWVEQSAGFSFDPQLQQVTLQPGAKGAVWITQGNPNVPLGTYHVSWEGDAVPWFTHDWEVTTYVPNATGGWAKVQTKNMNFAVRDFGRGMRLTIANPDTDPSAPARTIRNIQVLAPNAAPNEPNHGLVHHPVFAERLAPFGVVRYMGPMQANQNSVTTWENRAKVTDERYSRSTGVPVEHMVTLSNQTRSDPWFTMPYQADDNYIRQFAQYVKENLDPSLKVYVEYGNEVWAAGTPANDRLRSMVPPDQPSWTWYVQWANETARTFNIWHEVFEDQKDRVVRVAAAQEVNRWVSPRFYEALNGNFDAVAIAAYIGGGGGYNSSTTPEDIFNVMRQQMADRLDTTPRTGEPAAVDPNADGYLLGDSQPKGRWAYHKALADYFSNSLGREIPLLAYEGGQGLEPGHANASWYNAFLQVQRDPEMRKLYEELLDGWINELGADLFLQYNYTRAIDGQAAYGALEYQTQPITDAPKYQALMHYSATPDSAIPGDANLDGMVDIADLGILAANWQQVGIWGTADFNADSVVNIADLGILAANWQAGMNGGGLSFEDALAMFSEFRGVTIPEPAMAGMIAAAGIIMLGRRRPIR
jgi:hypothetical protein